MPVDFQLIIPTGSASNLQCLLGSFRATNQDPVIHANASYAQPADLGGRVASWMRQEPPWHSAKEWNRCRKLVPAESVTILCCDDLVVLHPGSLARLAEICAEAKCPIHASVVGNVIGSPLLTSSWARPVPELARVSRGTDIPLILAALPPGFPIFQDEEYFGYSVADHDFWEQSLRSGFHVLISREVIVAHDNSMTGRSVGRAPGGPAHRRGQVLANEQRFRSKWGYYKPG